MKKILVVSYTPPHPRNYSFCVRKASAGQGGFVLTWRKYAGKSVGYSIVGLEFGILNQFVGK